MQILSYRSSKNGHAVKAGLAAVVALTVFSNLAFTHATAYNPTILPPQTENEQRAMKVDERLIAATSKFAFKFYQQVLKQRISGNSFVSPTSVMLALAMTLNGAEGQTRQAIAHTLELEGMSVEEVNRAAVDFTAALSSTDPKLKVNIANSLWAKKGVSLKPAFVQRIKDYYAGEVAMLDFDSSAAPATINSWVSKKTEGKIEQIIDKIDPDLVLFLINAVYFKAQWQFSFDKAKTRDDVFRLAHARQKKLPMMFQSGRYFYQKGGSFQAIALPYANGRMSMYVFLPNEKTGLAAFERELTPENWENWMLGFRSTPGELTLPRFKLEYEAKLNDMLKTLGMSDAFDPMRANFSGIMDLSGGAKLYVSEVKHKAIAEVNEEGTVAAAATSVGVTLTSAAPPQEPFVMKVDRPFFIAIRDNTTGVILFMGSVMDPQ